MIQGHSGLQQIFPNWFHQFHRVTKDVVTSPELTNAGTIQNTQENKNENTNCQFNNKKWKHCTINIEKQLHSLHEIQDFFF